MGVATGALQRTLLGAVACAATAAFAFVEGARAQGGARVLAVTTGNNSELTKKVPITKRKAGKPRVAMSLGPGGLPPIASGDRLQATAEVEVTTDCVRRMPRCVGKPYRFNPRIRARLILGASHRVARPANGLQLNAQQERCRQRPPNREHHCVIVFTNTNLNVPDASQLPCSPATCHLNLVVEASHRKAKRRHKLLVGQDEPDGSVQGDMGRLNAVRFSPAAGPNTPGLLTNTPLTTGVRIRKGEAQVIYSQRLDGLRRGDQLAANATMTTDISHLPYNVRLKSRMILAPSPTATSPGKDVRKITKPRGQITEGNGFNCTQRRPSCVTSKVGVMEMRRRPRDASGNPIPLYVNLALDAARPGGSAKRRHTVEILQGGLGVVRYPAAIQG